MFHDAGLRDVARAFSEPDVDLEEWLGSRFPEPNHDEVVIRRIFAADIGRDRLGVGARRRGGRIRFAFPIAVLAGSKPECPPGAAPMSQDFTDEATARAWDVDPASNNPTRTEQLDILLALVEGEYRPGSAILDIGMGSGRVEDLLFGRLPDAFVVGVDASEAMLAIAAGRLSGLRDRYEVHLHDLREIRTLRLPPRAYRVAFSVQTIHNIPDRDKVEVIRWAFDTLEPGGLFLILDRFAVETPGLFSCFRATWERLGQLHGTDLGEGDTHASHLEVVAGRGDLPAGLETTLGWMRDAGFEAACLHLHANRALIAGRRPVGQG